MRCSLQTAPETCQQRTAAVGGGSVPLKSARTADLLAEWMRFGISQRPADAKPAVPSQPPRVHRPTTRRR